MRDSFSNGRWDALVTARTRELKNYRKILRRSIMLSAGRGTQSSTRVTPNVSAYAGELNLPAKDLVSGCSKIVELCRLGTILSF